VGRDGAGYKFDLGQIGNGNFLQMGLDCPNQLDPSGEIRVSAQLPRRKILGAQAAINAGLDFRL
jgi:hypothetical protein